MQVRLRGQFIIQPGLPVWVLTITKGSSSWRGSVVFAALSGEFLQLPSLVSCRKGATPKMTLAGYLGIKLL